MSLLSVVVPCYNEEENVELFYTELIKNDPFFEREKIELELLYVDDGSRDGTVKEVKKLIGRDKNARLVGKVLSMAEFYGRYPCHRVVNHAGRLVPGWREQAYLLQQEGVPLKDKFHVDLKRCQWDCENG